MAGDKTILKRENRFRVILALLDEQERVHVDDLADHFDVSADTIRRDLSEMSEQGLLRKIYGGAVKFQSAQENSFELRSRQNVLQKTTIARFAVHFVNEGDSLFLNASTTNVVFARELAKHFHHLNVVTNSTVIAHEFWSGGESNRKVFVLGGNYFGDEPEMQGSTVIDQIHHFHADHAFLAPGAVNAKHGFMDFRLESAQVIQAMAYQAQRVTILADSSKLGRTALNVACSLDSVDRLVTDILPSEYLTDALEAAGTKLFIAVQDGIKTVG